MQANAPSPNDPLFSLWAVDRLIGLAGKHLSAKDAKKIVAALRRDADGNDPADVGVVRLNERRLPDVYASYRQYGRELRALALALEARTKKY